MLNDSVDEQYNGYFIHHNIQGTPARFIILNLSEKWELVKTIVKKEIMKFWSFFTDGLYYGWREKHISDPVNFGTKEETYVW